MAEEAKNPSVFLLVGYHKKHRTIEYQVSDGMDCHRGICHSYYSLKAAKKEFQRVCDEGWEHI